MCGVCCHPYIDLKLELVSACVCCRNAEQKVLKLQELQVAQAKVSNYTVCMHGLEDIPTERWRG